MSIAVVPNPELVERLAGQFVVDRSRPLTLAVRAEHARQAAGLLAADLAELGVAAHVVGESESENEADLVFSAADAPPGHEAYALGISDRRMTIAASAAAGAFWATRSMLQLIAGADSESRTIALPGLRIADRPRFGWRGLMLDCARHFFPVDVVCRMVDLAALYKLNVLHWHLTDDQGWRVPIDRHPRLTEIAAWRGSGADRHGGFYTKAEIRRVVDHAAARGIRVMPEVELPGHCLAALAAYPELSCTGGPFEPASTWGIFEDVYCAGSERTFEFVEGVLDEVIDLFPSRYLHIGGDECPKTRWNACPRCRAAMAEHDLPDAEALQSWFVSRVARYLARRGKTPIGWDEILEGGLPQGAAVMSWRGTAGGVAAARAGHDVVMTPTAHCYLDYRQIVDESEPGAPFGVLELPTVYAYEPIPVELTPDEASHVLGTQANLWTERMPESDHLEYMAMPRLAALAEVAWSVPARRNFDDFSIRVEGHRRVLDARRINYRRPNGSAAQRDLRV